MKMVFGGATFSGTADEIAWMYGELSGARRGGVAVADGVPAGGDPDQARAKAVNEFVPSGNAAWEHRQGFVDCASFEEPR